MIAITELNNKELFDILCDGCDFDVSDVPKHGKGYVYPTAEHEGVAYRFDTRLVWDYSYGIEEWDGGSWIIDQPAETNTELQVITASKTEIAQVIEGGHIAVIKQIIEDGNVDPILGYFNDKLADLKSENLDPNNKKDRERMRSFAASIGKSKKPIVDMAADLQREVEAQAAHFLESIASIKGGVKQFKSEMDKIRDDAKFGAVEWDKTNDSRIDAHKNKIEQMTQSLAGVSEFTAEQLKNTLAKFDVFKIEKLNTEICEEYLPEYEAVVNQAITSLAEVLIPAAERREKDEAELAILRQQKADSDAKEASDKQARADKLQAEQDLADEKIRNKQREDKLKLDAENREKQAKIDADNAEKKRLADIEQAKIDAAAAIQAENERLQKEAAEKSANTENQRMKNNEALDDMMALGYSRDDAVKFLTMIAKKQIRNIAINY